MADDRQDGRQGARLGQASGCKDDAGAALLWQRFRGSGDELARARLVELHRPWARTMAAMLYAQRTHDDIAFDDYLQLGCVGLIESIDRFDPQRGAQFKTFAMLRIRGAILDGLVRLLEKNQQIAARKRLQAERLASLKADRRHDTQESLFRYLSEVGVGLALGVLLEGTGMFQAQAGEAAGGAAMPEVTYFRQTEFRNMQRLLGELIGKLSPQEQKVIRYHYLQSIEFVEIAGMLALSKGRIAQIHRQALMRLRGLMAHERRCDVYW